MFHGCDTVVWAVRDCIVGVVVAYTVPEDPRLVCALVQGHVAHGVAGCVAVAVRKRAGITTRHANATAAHRVNIAVRDAGIVADDDYSMLTCATRTDRSSTWK